MLFARAPFTWNIIQIRKNWVVQNSDTKHTLHLMLYHEDESTSYTGRNANTLIHRARAEEKIHQNIFYAMLYITFTWIWPHRCEAAGANESMDTATVTRRENNNIFGTFQWKYIMTTSSRNLSYIYIRVHISSPSNPMQTAYAPLTVEFEAIAANKFVEKVAVPIYRCLTFSSVCLSFYPLYYIKCMTIAVVTVRSARRYGRQTTSHQRRAQKKNFYLISLLHDIPVGKTPNVPVKIIFCFYYV